ncbi:unnamed protein product [Prunus armeniaca]
MSSSPISTALPSPSVPITADGCRRTASGLPIEATLSAGYRRHRSREGIGGCSSRATGSRLRDSLSDFAFPQPSKWPVGPRKLKQPIATQAEIQQVERVMQINRQGIGNLVRCPRVSVVYPSNTRMPMGVPKENLFAVPRAGIPLKRRRRVLLKGAEAEALLPARADCVREMASDILVFDISRVEA